MNMLDKVKGFLNTRKGFGNLTLIISGITILVVAGLLIMAFMVMGGAMMNATNNSQAISAINQTLIAIGSVPGWFALLITMIMMVIIISLIALVILQVRASGIARGI